MRTFLEFREFHSTLEYHKELNPALWNYGQLDPTVRTHLLAIAYEWQAFAHITADMVKDIIITGGNCNFNYTPESDIDVHLICDLSAMPIDDEEIRTDYIKGKKDLWAAQHKNIKIKGYPVELYAQDTSTPFPKDQGVYSIFQNKWLVEPTHHDDISYDGAEFTQKVQSLIHRINVALRNKAPLDDAKSLKDEITKVRGAAIQKDGEFAPDNLVFKELRNRGYIQKLTNYIEKIRAADLSLHEDHGHVVKALNDSLHTDLSRAMQREVDKENFKEYFSDRVKPAVIHSTLLNHGYEYRGGRHNDNFAYYTNPVTNSHAEFNHKIGDVMRLGVWHWESLGDEFDTQNRWPNDPEAGMTKKLHTDLKENSAIDSFKAIHENIDPVQAIRNDLHNDLLATGASHRGASDVWAGRVTHDYGWDEVYPLKGKDAAERQLKIQDVLEKHGFEHFGHTRGSLGGLVTFFTNPITSSIAKLHHGYHFSSFNILHHHDDEQFQKMMRNLNNDKEIKRYKYIDY